MRIQDRYLDYLRAFVRGCSLQAPLLDENDCILGLPLQHGLDARMFLLFYRGRELYFIGGEIKQALAGARKPPSTDFSNTSAAVETSLTAVLFCSWLRQKLPLTISLPSLAAEDPLATAHNLLWQLMREQCASVGRAVQPMNARWRTAFTAEELTKLEADLFTPPQQPAVTASSSTSSPSSSSPVLSPEQKATIKFLQKKMKNIEQDLASLKKWRFFFDLLQSSDFTPPEEDRWTKEGVTFKFQGRVGFQKVDFIYQKIKRWKAAEQLQVKRLAEVAMQLKAAQTNPVPAIRANIMAPMWADRWEKLRGGPATAAKTSAAEQIDCRRFKGPQGVIFYLGKSATANDKLRHAAKKEDWWVHLENYPSAHIYFSGKLEPELSLLTALASLLSDHGHLNLQEIPLIYTKVKNLKAIKGQAGGVLFKKEKHLRLPYQAWQDLLEEI
jgi:hypothetical protein